MPYNPSSFWSSAPLLISGVSFRKLWQVTLRKPSLTVCSDSSWRCSQLLLSATPEKAESSGVGAVTVSSCSASHGRPRSQQELSVSPMCHWQWNPEHQPRRVCGGTGWPWFIPGQGWHSALFLNAGGKDQRPVEHKLASLWGEALNFSLSGEVCLMKYKLLNHMCNKLLQKTATTSVSSKKRRACFYWYRLASTGICRDSVPPPAFCIPFLLLYLGFGLTVSLEWSGDSLPTCSFFYLHDHHVSTAFANVSATGMLWKGLISMHAVAAEHKYVWNSDHWYWNGDPEYKLEGF